MAYAQVVAASSFNVNISAPASAVFDGLTVSAGQRVLLTGQTNHIENGVWIFNGTGATHPMTRPTATGDQYVTANNVDNATVVWVTKGNSFAGTVWGIDPAKRVTVGDATLGPHALTRVALPPVQARSATTASINLASTFTVLDDRTATDGVMNTGAASTTLTCSTTSPFRPSDVGKRIVVAGAGVAGADLVTTIAAYTSISVVKLTTGCSTSVAGVNVSYGGVLLVGNGAAGSDIVLVKSQSTPSENGLYWANTGGSMSRCTEPLVPSRVVHVSEGEANAHKRFGLATHGAIVPGATGLTFASQDTTFNVDDYGAIADWNGTSGTDNLAAFNATLAAAKADLGLATGNKAARIIANGLYYLGGTLDIQQTVHLDGAATQSPSLGPLRAAPGAWLVFPANTTGIRIHSTEADDGGVGITAVLSKVGSTMTLSRGANFATACLGQPITISGSATPANDGTFTITALVDATSVSWTNPAGAADPGSVGGATASLSQSGDITTLTGGSGFTTDMLVGFIAISGSVTAANNGIFEIAFVNDSTSVSWTNVSGASDPSGEVSYDVGAVGWTFGGGFGDASGTTISNLTISCKDAVDPVTNNTGHGFYATCTFTMTNVSIGSFGLGGFALDGVFANGNFINDSDGNVDASILSNVLVGGCGRDGFHLQGGDANECNILSCTSDINGRYGFFDASFGNVYTGCTAQGNAENYHTERAINRATFLACYSEEGPAMSLYGQPTVYGGNMDADSFTPYSPVHIQSFGSMGRTPLSYRNTRGSTIITFSVGTFDAGDPLAMDAFLWATESPLDFSRLRYTDDPPGIAHGWWTLENSSSQRAVIRFPSTQSNARSPAPWMLNGLYVGDTQTAQVLFLTGTSPPPTQTNGLPQTYELGDVVWQSEPAPGAPIGQISVAAGTLYSLNNGVGGATGSTAAGTNTLTFDNPQAITGNPVDGVLLGQYVTIAGEADVRRILSDLDPVTFAVEVDGAAFVGVGAGTAVAFSPPAFEPFGRVGGAGELSIDVSAGGPVTLTDAEAANEILKFIGDPVTTVDVFYPAPAADADAYERTVRNSSGQDVVVGVVGGAGSTVAVADSSNAKIGFDQTDGVFPITGATTAGRQTMRAAVFTASGNLTAPTNVSQVTLVGFGAGGGAGGGCGGDLGVGDFFPCGGGGAGGAQQSSATVSVTPGATYAVTIGVGGAGGSGGPSDFDGSDGGDGGDTTFGSLATFRGATGVRGGSKVFIASPAVYMVAAPGGAPGALRPPSHFTAFTDAFRSFSTGYGSGGDGIDNQTPSSPRVGIDSVQGFSGGAAGTKGANSGATNYGGGGPGGGGGAGPAGPGGAAGGGGNASSAANGTPGSPGGDAGGGGGPANTGAGGGGGGAGGSASTGHNGGQGGDGGAGGSGKLTVLYVA